MVARYHQYIPGSAQGAQPGKCLPELHRQAHMSEVAGYQQLVQVELLQVLAQGLQHFRAVFETAPARPGQVTQGALAQQLAPVHALQGAEVGVGNLGK